LARKAKKQSVKVYPIVHRIFDHGWYEFFVNALGQTVITHGVSFAKTKTVTIGHSIINKGYIAECTGDDKDGGVCLIEIEKRVEKYTDYEISGWGIQILP
jgi:hypothetical protein